MIAFGIAIFFLLGLNRIAYGLEWQRLDIGTTVLKTTAIAIDKDDPKIIYIGLEQALYKTSDQGKSWQLLGDGLVTDINYLLIDQQDKKAVYAATKNGLFRSTDEGINWQKIFSGKDVLERDVLGITLCQQAPKTIFIATRNGVFFSPVNRIIWQKIGGKLSDAAVLSIACDPNIADILYLVSNKGLFETKNRMASYERLYIGSSLESEDSTTDIDSEEEETGAQEYFLKHIAIDPRDRNNLYLSTRDGLLSSQDAGKSWQGKQLFGLLDKRINYALVSNVEDRFFLATQSGVFDCKEDGCIQLFKGMEFKDCSQLALDSQNTLYAASDKGFFKMSLTKREKESEAVNNIDRNHSDKEPSIQRIQKVAIRYAEVEPEKIKEWRKKAKMKAILPKFTLGLDRSESTNYEIYTGATTKYVYEGPNDKSNGWDVALSWELGDLIWNEAQTSIDVRSRLMVQLRDDILNEVNRLFFERKRLKAELSQEKISGKQRFEKELRIEELTASIDGFTGGFLSRSLENSQ